MGYYETTGFGRGRHIWRGRAAVQYAEYACYCVQMYTLALPAKKVKNR